MWKPVTQDQANNGDTMVGGHPPEQGEGAGKAFFKQLQEVSRSKILASMGGL